MIFETGKCETLNTRCHKRVFASSTPSTIISCTNNVSSKCNIDHATGSMEKAKGGITSLNDMYLIVYKYQIAVYFSNLQLRKDLKIPVFGQNSFVGWIK